MLILAIKQAKLRSNWPLAPPCALAPIAPFTSLAPPLAQLPLLVPLTPPLIPGERAVELRHNTMAARALLVLPYQAPRVGIGYWGFGPPTQYIGGGYAQCQYFSGGGYTQYPITQYPMPRH